MAEEKINDLEISCLGIDLLVNNEWDQSQALFTKHKDHSPLLNFCSSLVTFVKACMTFDEQSLELAQKELEITEKLCSNSVKSVSTFKKVFGSISNKKSEKEQSLENKFTKAILVADCKLFLGILTFIRQETSSYLATGILQIRKSWKTYAKIQKQLYEIYKKLEPNASHIYGSDLDTNLIQILIDDNDDNEGNEKASTSNGSASVSSDLNELNELSLEDDDSAKSMSLETVKRLLGGVSFGYGIFQICLSFMPPSALKLLRIFGFEGDRTVALKAINFTSISGDMRAPFADMMLLWYSTVATPLFGVSEVDIQISNEDTRLVIEKNLAKYPKSSLFHYYQGKYHRMLFDLKSSMTSFVTASENSKHIREIQFISIYEMGWLNLMDLNYKKALEYFDVLSNESRWSKSFNAYICTILSASMGNYSLANIYVKEALKLLAAQSKKKNPVEVFAKQRLDYFKKNPIKSSELCELLCIEMLFLWICIPFCEKENLNKMLDICDKINDKHFNSMKCLFEGEIRMVLGNSEFGEQCFNESLARGEDEAKKAPFGKYVLPYANFKLATIYTNEKNYEQAKLYMHKARDGYKDYELDDRIQAQIKSLSRRIKHYTEGPKLAEALKQRQEEEEAIKKQKEMDQKNFYVP